METIYEDRANNIAEVQHADEYHLLAMAQRCPGEPLLRIDCDRTTRPSRHSLQIEERLHLNVGTGLDPQQLLERYYWRFLNHSCAPNALIRGLDVVALSSIRCGEEITFDYDTTEYDLAEPFACRCGSDQCRCTIRGFKHLGY